MSNRLKTIIAITYIIIIWIFAILFSLPMVLSFETGVSIDGSFMCDTKWTESELNSFFIIKYLFIFIIRLEHVDCGVLLKALHFSNHLSKNYTFF